MMPQPYYQDETVTLYHSRCEGILPELEQVDHIITDPPYSAHVHGAARSSRMVSANDRGGKYGADVRRNVDLGFTHLTDEERLEVAGEFARLARRWVLAFSDTESAHLWQRDLTNAGLQYVRTCFWHKMGSTPQFSGDRPAVAVEAITVAHPSGRKRWNAGGKHGLYAHPIVLDRGRSGAGRLHTTQKPESLMAELIADFTDEGDVILDPYAGSGTTLMVAKRAGRLAIGVEQDEHYCEVIATRLGSVGRSLFDEVTA